MSEEQREEIEALQAIYIDEFEFLEGCSEDSPPYRFKLKLLPTPEEENNFVALDLNICLPEGYPEEVLPDISFDIKKGISEKQKPELTELIQSQAEDNLGCASIFVVAEAVKEWLVDNNVEGQDGSMYAEMMRRMQQKQVEKKKVEVKKAINKQADFEKNATVGPDEEEEERIRKRQAGTPMTAESFAAWKLAFDKEMDLKAEEEARMGTSSGVMTTAEKEEFYAKPTGKQLFLSNKAGMEEALSSIGDSGETIAKAMSEATRQAKKDAGLLSADDIDIDVEDMDIKESLFLDDDEYDLDDLIDDDEDSESEYGSEDDDDMFVNDGS